MFVEKAVFKVVLARHGPTHGHVPGRDTMARVAEACRDRNALREVLSREWAHECVNEPQCVNDVCAVVGTTASRVRLLYCHTYLVRMRRTSSWSAEGAVLAAGTRRYRNGCRDIGVRETRPSSAYARVRRLVTQ